MVKTAKRIFPTDMFDNSEEFRNLGTLHREGR